MVRAHFAQGAQNDWVYLDLETKPKVWAKVTESEYRHVTILETWSGGIWAIGGTHPAGFPYTPYVSCT